MKYLKIDNVQKFEDIYLKISFDERNMIKFIDKKFSCRKLLSFLFEKWKLKEITTRPFIDEDKILHEVWLVLNNININTKLSYDELNNLDEFNCTIDEIDKILKVNDLPDNNTNIQLCLERFKYAKEIKINCKNLRDQFNKQQSDIGVSFDDYTPISIFKKLIEQLNWNLVNREKYLNAVCISIRSFWEQFIIWIYISQEENISEQQNLITQFVSGNTLTLKEKIIKDLNKNGRLDSSQIINYLEFIGISKNNAYFTKFNNFLNNYFELNSVEYNVLNEGIHSLHRIYLLSDYNKKLEKINYICNLTNKFLQEIDIKVLNTLNQKIISKLKENN